MKEGENIGRGLFLGFIAITCFALTLPATRVAVEYLDPTFVGLGRAAAAASLAVIILLFSRSNIPSLAEFKLLALVALGVVFGFPILSSWAMQFLHASHGGVILGMLPLTTAIAGSFINRERPSLSFWISSLAGALTVVIYMWFQGEGQLHIADLILAVAVICAACGYAFGAKLSKEMGGWRVTCWSLAISLPFLLIPTLTHLPSNVSDIPFQAMISFAYLALVSQFAGFLFWYKSLALGGVAKVSQIQLLQPFITLIAAALLLGEQITLLTFSFVFLVAAIVWFSKSRRVASKI